MAAEKRIHVLITEDNEDIVTIYKAKLQAEGFSVATAEDGVAAFARIAEQMPDVILLDIIMPGMDGMEFLAKARKMNELQHVPIVIMTNLGQDEDRVQCEKLGATKFLLKTEVSLEDLVTTVEEVVAAATKKS